MSVVTQNRKGYVTAPIYNNLITKERFMALNKHNLVTLTCGGSVLDLSQLSILP